MEKEDRIIILWSSWRRHLHCWEKIRWTYLRLREDIVQEVNVFDLLFRKVCIQVRRTHERVNGLTVMFPNRGICVFSNSQFKSSKHSRIKKEMEKVFNRLTHILQGHNKSIRDPLHDIRARSIAGERTLAIKNGFHRFGVGQNNDCPIQNFDL